MLKKIHSPKATNTIVLSAQERKRVADVLALMIATDKCLRKKKSARKRSKTSQEAKKQIGLDCYTQAYYNSY